MTDKKIEVQPITSAPELIRAPDYKKIYVNTTRMAISSWDIRMHLGQSSETLDGGNLNEDLVSVIMSPAHAKAMLQSLAKTIQAYEQHFGEILSPELAMKSTQEMIASSDKPV